MSKLENLHDLLCDDFERLLKDKNLSTSDRKLLMEFLKENGVSSVGSNNPKIKSIIDNLPFSEDDEREAMSVQ